jgi:hypothetical protein
LKLFGIFPFQALTHLPSGDAVSRAEYTAMVKTATAAIVRHGSVEPVWDSIDVQHLLDDACATETFCALTFRVLNDKVGYKLLLTIDRFRLTH